MSNLEYSQVRVAETLQAFRSAAAGAALLEQTLKDNYYQHEAMREVLLAASDAGRSSRARYKDYYRQALRKAIQEAAAVRQYDLIPALYRQADENGVDIR